MRFKLWLEETQNIVLAHVSGPPGVGKTTLMKQIKHAFPQVLVVDLDSLDDFGERKLGFPFGWKANSYSDEKLNKLHSVRQSALDKFINNSVKLGKSVILFGIHHEGDTVFKFPTAHRLYLMRPIEDIVRDRVKRDGEWYKSKGMPFDAQEFAQEARDDVIRIVRELRSMGYKEVSAGQAFTFLSGLLDNALKRNPEVHRT